MKKRLLAVLLACCMAASMASAVFADEPPALTEPPAAVEPADPDPPAPSGKAIPAPAVDESAAPTPAPELVPEPTAEPQPTAAPAEEATPEPTTEPTAAPAEPTAAPTETPPELPPEIAEEAPEQTPAATLPPEPVASPEPTEPTPTQAPAPTETPETAAPDHAPALQAAPAASVTVESVELRDTISADGCFTAVVNGSDARQPGLTYTWYRSRDGQSWEAVTPQQCSGNGWNITPGSEQRLNAALDSLAAKPGDTERLWYRVEVTGDTALTSAAAQVPYYIQLQNGGFETPAVAGNSGLLSYPNAQKRSHFIQTPDAATDAGIVWRTTGTAPHWNTKVDGRYIEVVDGTRRAYTDTINGRQSTDANDPTVCYHAESAHGGNQFAELNCEAYGALYQDVLTVPGATLYWSLSHRGRTGADSMVLLIAPVAMADAITQELSGCAGGNVAEALNRTVTVDGESHTISEYIVKEGSGNGILTDGNTAWAVHGGTYTVPAGQYVSRFFFLAVSTAGGDKCEGNLLDDVWFSTQPAPLQPDEAALRLTKQLDGTLTDAERAAIWPLVEFTVTNGAGTAVATVRGDAMAQGSTGAERTLVLHLPLSDSMGRTERYTVTETAHAAPAGLLYLGSRTALNGEDWQTAGSTPQLADLTLNTTAETVAAFENTYARQTGSLRITKAVTDETLRTEANAVTNVFAVDSLPVGRYTLTYDSGTVETRELTAPGVLEIAMPGVQSVTVSGVPVGRYTVTETAHPDLESYYCTTAEASAAVQVPSGGVGEAVITNTYAPFLTLTVTKRVTGGMGDTRRGFAFTATVDDVPVTQASESVAVSGGAALTAEGFTIPHRGSVTIGRLRPGQRVAVTEAALADYETSIDDGNAVTLGTSYAGTMGAENTALTVVNNKDGVPPTGLHVDRAPGWLVLAALACLALTCRRRRRTP